MGAGGDEARRAPGWGDERDWAVPAEAAGGLEQELAAGEQAPLAQKLLNDVDVEARKEEGVGEVVPPPSSCLQANAPGPAAPTSEPVSTMAGSWYSGPSTFGDWFAPGLSKVG